VDLESDLIDEVASLLTVARTPAIIAGRGAVLADAGAVIESLADRIGAVLCTSVQARELFRNHRQNIGIVGPFGHEVTAELLQEADCVLAVGVALNPFQTGSIDGNARVIQLDVNPESFGQFSSVDYAIVADARLGVSVLDRALEAAKTRHASAWMTEAMQARVAAARVPSPLPVPTVDKDGRVPVARMLRGLDAALPAAGRVVIVDGGDFLFNVIDEISISDPKSWVWTADFSSTGVGLGIALGVTVAAPNRECVLFVGDGGLMMSLQELETAVRERIPLIVVVLDNCAYQAEVRVMDSIGKPPTLGQFDEADSRP
jgi:thiamine pyrophosphate-dependent acetolactate synthase large subunit-like protein